MEGYKYEGRELHRQNSLVTLLGLTDGVHRNIAFVGAGGKTTTMFHLAKELAERKEKVLVTATTQIYKPKNVVVVSEAASVWQQWELQNLIVAGRPAKDGKIASLGEEALEGFRGQGRYLLVEADGAKGMSLKIPREKEPVIPDFIDMVVGIVGMDCLQKPLGEVCFLPEKVTAFLEEIGDKQIEKNHNITKEDMTAVITSPLGLRKGVGDKKFCLLFNKVDDYKTLQSVLQIFQTLECEKDYHGGAVHFGNKERSWFK